MKCYVTGKSMEEGTYGTLAFVCYDLYTETNLGQQIGMRVGWGKEFVFFFSRQMPRGNPSLRKTVTFAVKNMILGLF